MDPLIGSDPAMNIAVLMLGGVSLGIIGIAWYLYRLDQKYRAREEQRSRDDDWPVSQP